MCLCKTLQKIGDLHNYLNSTKMMIEHIRTSKFQVMNLLHDEEQKSLINEVNCKDGLMYEIILPSTEKKSCFTFNLDIRIVLEME